MLISQFAAGDVRTARGRALVEERFAAVRRQIPVIYVLALVNLFSLQLATAGKFTIGFNLPTAFVICAALRCLQWLSPRRSQLSIDAKLTRLRQTTWVALLTCIGVCGWFLSLIKADPGDGLAVMLFGALTAIATAYGLSSLPVAARIPLLFLALPLSGGAIFLNDSRYLGAGASLAVVAILLIPLIEVHNRHFVALVESRWVIAQERERAEEATREALVSATTDFLTGLLNRRAFVAALEEEVAKGSEFSVALLDLDRFKPMNDTFGHAAGDELLRTVAVRLRNAVADRGLVARLGGDEFALMLRNTNPADAIRLGERLLASVRAPATINGRQFAVSACCGLTISTAEPAASPTLLLSQADVALYEAKKQNASGMAIFEPSMAAPGRRRAKVERALQLPNVLDDVEILYQPIVDLRSERIVSLEALARWTDPELGRISPAEFVPIAEQLNVIGGLSDQLTSEAMREALSWPEHIRLSVNLSAVQLSSPRSGQAVLRNLQRNRLSPHRLQVEVTETAIMADFPTARENLRALRSAGVKIVLDDFGAGYASISYLREMVFDEIKLDGSLIQNADSDPDRQRLLSALIGLCGALGLGAVAEHIETEEQMLLLKQLGCTAGQGFYLYRPLPAHAARKLLRGNLEALTQSAGRWKRAAA